MKTLQEALNYTPVELTFGTSGLRGLVTDMTDLECYINTAGFLRFLAQTEGLRPNTNVYIAGDLRRSTPRIVQAAYKAVKDQGHNPVYCGTIPTPALAYYAMQQHAPCVMVTGSHIPDNRNGIKFYKASGEVLKDDELAIKEAVALVRTNVYTLQAAASGFTANGMLAQPEQVPPADTAAYTMYMARYTSVFANKPLKNCKIVVYQHSAVGRDMLVELLEALGAQVQSEGRTDTFVPLDTENVTPDDQAYFKALAKNYPDAFAIVSTDGDSDRPFVIDQNGVFHRGDVLGAIIATWLKADFAALPISSSDAVDKHLTKTGISWQHTKVGSPYVIAVMEHALQAGKSRVVGWEVNGGFLLGTDIQLNGHTLKALPTRDAMLPIIGALVAATLHKQSVSDLFATLPQRATQAGLLDNFPVQVSAAILQQFSADTSKVHAQLERYFNSANGFSAVKSVNSVDGVRIYFSNGDIAHIRPSGNAPQLRIYSVADTQQRADDIVKRALAEPDGIFRRMQQEMQ